MSLTKDQIVNSVRTQINFSKTRSYELVESVLGIIKKSLVSGEGVLISRFGKFCVKDKMERRGRDPQTGKDLILGSRKVVTFKCSSVLREKLNDKES